LDGAITIRGNSTFSNIKPDGTLLTTRH